MAASPAVKRGLDFRGDVEGVEPGGSSFRVASPPSTTILIGHLALAAGFALMAARPQDGAEDRVSAGTASDRP